MIRYAFYFSAAFVFLVSLPAIAPFAGDSLPLFLFYTPFFYLADRLHDTLPVDILLNPLLILGVGAVFWAFVGAVLGIFLKFWPFRSHLILRVAFATATFLATSWILYSAAQLAETLR
jgi:hypothetical protein